MRIFFFFFFSAQFSAPPMYAFHAPVFSLKHLNYGSPYYFFHQWTTSIKMDSFEGVEQPNIETEYAPNFDKKIHRHDGSSDSRISRRRACKLNYHNNMINNNNGAYDYDLIIKMEHVNLEDFRKQLEYQFQKDGELSHRQDSGYMQFFSQSNDVQDLINIEDINIEDFRLQLIQQHEKEAKEADLSLAFEHHLPAENISQGSIIVASEKIKGHLRKAVILVVEYSKVTGMKGLIMNHPTSTKINHFFTNSLRYALNHQNIFSGGVEGDRTFLSLIYDDRPLKEGYEIRRDLYLCKLNDLKEKARLNKVDKDKTRLLQGFTAWTHEEVNEAVSNGYWYVAPSSIPSSILLESPEDAQNLWSRILSYMGGKYLAIAQNMPTLAEPEP
mmetsp:Transcript_23257/g.30370  ORF Transcript_23257/g.30370 Transcript_23257/m.30370 type:complete len:385 (-) Transcript_23257:83-1237(-)